MGSFSIGPSVAFLESDPIISLLDADWNSGLRRIGIGSWAIQIFPERAAVPETGRQLGSLLIE